MGLGGSITPNVQQSASDAETLGERDDVFAGIHSLDGVATKFVALPAVAFFVPLCGSFPAKCATSNCLALGVHSTVGFVFMYACPESVHERTVSSSSFRNRRRPQSLEQLPRLGPSRLIHIDGYAVY